MTSITYYYFFSTAAQCLAALIAFLGVFVVFRLQVLISDRAESISKLEKIGMYTYFPKPGLTADQVKEEIIRDLQSRVTRLTPLINNIKADFFGPFIGTAATVGLCLAGIAMTEFKGEVVILKSIFVAVWFLIFHSFIWALLFIKGALD